MATTKTEQAETTTTEPTVLPNLRFDNPWKATFLMEKVVTAKTSSVADGGDYYYPLLTVVVRDAGTAPVKADDRVLIHAHSETLIAELKRVKPQRGALLTIDYQGKRKTKSGREVRVFEIDSPDTAEQNWDDCPF